MTRLLIGKMLLLLALRDAAAMSSSMDTPLEVLSSAQAKSEGPMPSKYHLLSVNEANLKLKGLHAAAVPSARLEMFASKAKINTKYEALAETDTNKLVRCIECLSRKPKHKWCSSEVTKFEVGKECQKIAFNPLNPNLWSMNCGNVKEDVLAKKLPEGCAAGVEAKKKEAKNEATCFAMKSEAAHDKAAAESAAQAAEEAAEAAVASAKVLKDTCPDAVNSVEAGGDSAGEEEEVVTMAGDEAGGEA